MHVAADLHDVVGLRVQIRCVGRGALYLHGAEAFEQALSARLACSIALDARQATARTDEELLAPIGGSNARTRVLEGQGEHRYVELGVTAVCVVVGLLDRHALDEQAHAGHERNGAGRGCGGRLGLGRGFGEQEKLLVRSNYGTFVDPL